jgi:hypothetical protein
MLMEMKKEAIEHLQKHVVYPATKTAIIEACNKMMEVEQSDREYFERYLPDWTYNNADEVVRAVGVSEHLDHVTYPTSKRELVKACNKMSDVPKSYREWFERNLPDRGYNNRDDVVGTLKGVQHVRLHVTYPASKALIVEGCNNMMEVPQVYKELFERVLPDRTYNNPDDVIKAFRS